MKVIATGRRNGVVFRYADGEWTPIGKVRKEQTGRNRWRAFASLETYREATSRDAAIRLLLTALDIDPGEYQPESAAIALRAPQSDEQGVSGAPGTPSRRQRGAERRMTEPTDADRDAAEVISAAWETSGQGYGYLDELIADALAEERAKARAPFLALADDLDANINWREWGIADRIRRAAEEDA